MKKILVLLAGITLTLSTPAIAQPKVGCNDRAIRLQSEQIKVSLKAQGMTVYRDAMIGMESQETYPIAVQLDKGKMYQMIYVGNNMASKISFELVDDNGNKLDSRVLNNPTETNYIVYSFVPERSGIYMVGLTQKIRKQAICGSFSIMEKTIGTNKN